MVQQQKNWNSTCRSSSLKLLLVLVWALPVMSIKFVKSVRAEHHKLSYIDIKKGDQPVARYMCAFDPSTKESLHETYKVYYHILDEAGEPITKGAGGKFTHHRGLYIGWAKLELNGKRLDTWHMKGTTQQHKQVIEEQANLLKTRIDWMAGKNRILEETRTFTIQEDASSYVTILFTSELHATEGDILLAGDPEHAGMQFRPHNDVVKSKSAKYTFHQEKLDVKKTKDIPWVAMSYKLRDLDWTVQHINHPSNPKGSVYSAYRDYGRFGCFHNKVKIAKGESLTFNYTIRILKGDAPTRETLQAAYLDAIKAE